MTDHEHEYKLFWTFNDTTRVLIQVALLGLVFVRALKHERLKQIRPLEPPSRRVLEQRIASPQQSRMTVKMHFKNQGGWSAVDIISRADLETACDSDHPATLGVVGRRVSRRNLRDEAVCLFSYTPHWCKRKLDPCLLYVSKASQLKSQCKMCLGYLCQTTLRLWRRRPGW